MSSARRLAVPVLVTALVTVAAACSSSSDNTISPEPTRPRPTRTSNLFTLSATGGTFEKVDEERYTMRLTGVSGTVVRFSDRPQRVSETMTTASLIDSWNALFGDDPPNAALVVTDGSDGEDVVVFKLNRPRYDRAAGTLELDGTVLAQAGAAGGFGFNPADVDPALPASFADVTLFIDDSAEPPPGPAFYVTFGGEPKDGITKPIDNVVAYMANGEALPEPVLGPGTVAYDGLRGMAIDAADNLYVTNSNGAEGMVLAFGPPDPTGVRSPRPENPLSSTSAGNPALLHPYGLTFDPDGRVLISSPDAFVVTRVDPASRTPAPVASSLGVSYPGVNFLPGTVVPGNTAGDGLPAPEPTGLAGPRGIAVAGNTLYAADYPAQKVRAYDVATGAFVGDVLHKELNNGNPVGLLVVGSTLLVTSDGSDNVMAVDLTEGCFTEPAPDCVTELIPKQSGDVVLDHPSGLAVGPDGALYVASRVGRQILRYDLAAGTASVFAGDLSDEPQHLIAVPSSGVTAVR